MLAANPCQLECDWSGTDRAAGGRQMFACAGCGSQWTTAEPWTPAQADGTVPAAVTSARSAAAAGSGGSGRRTGS